VNEPRSLAVLASTVIEGASPPELAEIANSEHALFMDSGRAMVEHAIRAGEALMAAKAQTPHGEWLPWVEANFHASERTARAYMRVYANRQRAADLAEPSLRKALAAISGEIAHVGYNSGDDEWCTPARYTEAAARAARRHARHAAVASPGGALSRELRHAAAASDRAHAGSSIDLETHRPEIGPQIEGGPPFVGSANWSPDRAAIDPTCDRWPAVSGPQQAAGVEAGDRASGKERSLE
jgi:hypothetical protein